MNGQEIRTIREQLGLSQRELSEKIGVSRNTIWYWESDQKIPGEDSLKQLAELAKSVGQSVSKSEDTVSKSVSNSDEKVTGNTPKSDIPDQNVTGKSDTFDPKVTGQPEKVTGKSDRVEVTGDRVDVKPYYETMYQDAKGLIPLCVINQPQNGDQKLQVKGFYEIPQIPSLLAEADRLNGDYHIYTGIHPLRERPSEGRGKEKDILGIALFAADVDAKDFIDDPVEKQKCLVGLTTIPKVMSNQQKKANEERAFYQWTDKLLSECKAEALKHIREVTDKVSLPPTAIIDSGHGYYPIFKLDKFVEFESNQHREELKKLNKTLHEVFSADSTFDFARILRVPGTRNIKPGYPADCKLIEFHPELRYTLDDIRKFEKLLEPPHRRFFGRRRRVNASHAGCYPR